MRVSIRVLGEGLNSLSITVLGECQYGVLGEGLNNSAG